ncbi:MAG: pilus assembly protein [Leucothrix sp.]
MTIRFPFRKPLLAFLVVISALLTGNSSAFAAGGTFSAPSDSPATGIIINSYASVTNIINNNISLDSASGFSAGDAALLIQMKGVTVNRSDSSSHGDITDYNTAGRFEFVSIATVAGNTVVLTENPSVAFQVSGVVQLIRVERYNNQTITGTLSAMPWDGEKGGVVAIDDAGTLTLQGTIDVSGLGFTGGQLAQEQPYDRCFSDQSNYTGPLQRATGSKGEGIVVDVANHRARRGHNANGGGGGNITDAGGGGGSNFGAGGMGGRELDLCDFNSHHGGLGGQSLDYTPMNRLFMGGGGGSGSEVSQVAKGGARMGGGIVIIRAKKLISNGGAILAKGLSANNDDGNGADGGGAGGSIGLVINNGIIGNPEIEVPGGTGGDEFNGRYAHGTGGGGGGGTVILNGPSCASVHWTAQGGASGISMLGAQVGDPKWGATDGQSGGCLTNFTALPPVEPFAPPSPSMEIKACEAVVPLSASPDGLEDLSFPKGYWATSYYEGTDGVEGATYTDSLDGQGNTGQKVFKGEAYWGGDGKSTITIRSEGSQVDKRWGANETPSSPNLHHPSYTGDTWTSSGNPFYQIDMRRKMTFSGELKFGYGEEDVIDDVIEVFVNGVRSFAYFSGGSAPNARPGAGSGETIKLNANDEVMVRFMNWGNIGGFNVELSSPMPDCSDSPADGTTNESGNVNSYGTASHSIDSDIRLGAAIDSESTSIASTNADGDGTDDDGIVFTPMILGESSTITANVSGAGYLQVWIDWNGDGDFNDPDEQIATDLQDGGTNDTSATAGVITFDTTVPNSATISPTFIRFRWSSTPGLASTGPAEDGEAEDYQVTTSGNPLSCDMNELLHGVYPTASVAKNSSDLNSDTLVYQAAFDNENWQGEITAFNLKTTDDDGNVKSVVWNAANTITRSGRKVFTYKPNASGNRGRVFTWSKLNSSQKALLRAGGNNQIGKARIAWVKGSGNNEGTNGPLRKRTSILGDIVHSNLNFRNRYTNFGYKQLSGSESTSYATYLTAKRNTKDTLFVGANDGMLHALDAENGDELFAYIPNHVFPKLATISNPKYGCDDDDCLPHQYLVDGKSTVADAYFDSQWHDVLIGTLGLGGKAIYALDVSKPTSFNASNVLWEISNTQAPNSPNVFANHMGLSIPEPVVVKMQNGKWVAVVANGYESENHKAVLFIIDIKTGQLIKSINTGIGSAVSKNGLSSPAAVDSDGDYVTDVIYAGDLQGNLWAFDVSSPNPANWAIKYGTQQPAPLLRACVDPTCALSKRITAKPQVGRNPIGGLMVYVGTGKYTELGDNFRSDKTGVVDTFYALHDNGQTINRSKLVEQKILQEINVSTDLKSRITTTNEVSYPTQQGWYMDLVTPPNAQHDGERVISQALLRENRLIFVTLTPSQNSCTWSGSSWLMELNAVDGNRLSIIPIDINNDMEFTELDNVDYDGDSTIISGVQQSSLGMVFEPPAIINHNTRAEGKYQTGTGGSVSMLRESNSRFSGRMSWKKLR